MLPLGRVVAVALLLGVVTPSVSEGQSVLRRGKRDFPTFSKCPVHRGIVDATDPFVFTAASSSATLTFLTCDDRAFGGSEPYGSRIDVSIDDLIVVDLETYNANRLLYPAEVPVDYRVELEAGACYIGTAVTDVFRRNAASPRSPVMPLYERFEGPPRGWTLANACFDLESRDTLFSPESQSRSLILARQLRSTDPDSPCPLASTEDPDNLCSMASVRVNRLVKGRKYVVDFAWFAAGFESEGQDILTLVVDDQQGTIDGRVRRPARPTASRAPTRTRR